MPDVSNLREDGALPPTFDHVAIVGGDRVEQPGTLYHPDTVVPSHIENDRKARQSLSVSDRASDKFSVRAFNLQDLGAHQLLPSDPHRRSALIVCMHAVGIFVGTEASISNFAGNQAATIAASLLAANGIWHISNSLSSLLPPFQYTSKAPLWYCAATTADIGASPCFVQAIIENFDSGTPVT